MDISIFQGESRNIEVGILDVDGSPLDLTGASIDFKIKGGTVVIEKSVGSGITVNGPGEITIALTPDDTSIDERAYWYEIRITISGTVQTVVQAGVIIRNSLFVGA